MTQNKLPDLMKENLGHLTEDLMYLAEDLKNSANTPSIDSCNVILAHLAIYESDIELIRGLVQKRKSSFLEAGMPSPLMDTQLRLVKPRAELDELLSIPQVAEKLKCTRQTVYKKHMLNGLKVVYPTGPKGNKKIRLSDFEEYLASLKSA